MRDHEHGHYVEDFTETITQKSVNAFIKEDIIVNEIAVTVKKMFFVGRKIGILKLSKLSQWKNRNVNIKWPEMSLVIK